MLFNAKQSIRDYENNKSNSLKKMKFECPDEITVYQGETIDYNKIPTKIIGGQLQINKEISTKTLGDKEIELTYSDAYYNKVSKKVVVHVVNREKY